MKRIVQAVIFCCAAMIGTETVVAKTVVDMEMAPTGHYIVEATLNGNFTQKFIVDTGADGIMVPKSLFTKMNIAKELVSEETITAANSSYQAPIFDVNTLRIGDSVVSNLKAFVDNPIQLPGFEDQDLGVIPNTFLKEFLVEFDQENKKLILHKKATRTSEIYPGISFEKIPMDYNDGVFIDFPIVIDGQEIRAHFDSGAGNTLMLNWKAANLIGLNESSSDLKIAGKIKGADGKPENLYMRKGRHSVQIEGVKMDARHMVASLPVLKDVYGDMPFVNLGIGIFKERKLLIDYERRLMYFSK